MSPPPDQAVRVRLLGPFMVTGAGRSTGAWPRPSARRLCQLVLISPGRRVRRDLLCDELFPDLDPRAAARSVSKALSMARATLFPLGGPAFRLLAADLTHIWAAPDAEVDAQALDEALRTALSLAPGTDRDTKLAAALAEDGELLADEPYADWALRPRERLETLRQEARLTLARDRSKGAGRSRPEAVVTAWEACFEHDQACEEAADALVRAYFAQGRRQLAVDVFERCRAALDELGLRISPSLAEVYAAAAFEGSATWAAPPAPAAAAGPRSVAGAQSAAGTPALPRDELRTVSVLFAEVTTPAGLASQLGPEGLRDLVGGSLAAVIAEVEALGGMVTAVSGGGLQAMFGAPEAHEDDPERAVRAAFRSLTALDAVAASTAASVAASTAASMTASTAASVTASPAGRAAPVLRIGVETGQAVLGPIGGGGRVEYSAVGEVVGIAAGLQSAARPGSALIGPATQLATGHLFSWGAREEVMLGPGAAPLTATYLGNPKATSIGRRPRLGGRGRLVGRQREFAALSRALRAAVQGHGSLVLLTGEPGLGKTRLVQECRKRVTAWTGAGGGRTPLWLEGRCASYASSTPYGLYRQLLASWAGVAPDQPEAVLRPALERSLTEVMGDTDLLPLLARMMGLPAGVALGRMNPADLQRATFAALRSLVSRLVATGPVVLVLEDLHWADPTSLRLTRDLAALTAGRPLLMLATSRPGAVPAGAGLERLLTVPVHRVVLAPLPSEDERELARSLIGEAASQEVLDTVLTSVDGNPLFLEERLQSLLETRTLVREDGVWQLGQTTGSGVPQVLERLVRSRVDRLSPVAREVIRPASVLGPEFPLSLLTAVCAAAEPLEPAVAELCAKDLWQEVARQPDATFRFRHALIQEAVYEGLLRAERGRLHGRAAWALEAASSERLDEVAAVLGHHFAAAGEVERAVTYLELAGDHATAAFANDEAVSVFRAALAVIEDPHAARGAEAQAEARLQAKLANVLWRTARRDQARQAFRQALRTVDEADVLLRAHLETRLGRLEMGDHHFVAAAAAFDVAQALLGTDPAGMDDAAVDQWLEMMLDGRASLHALRNEPDLALATLQAARPLLQARGSPARTYSFYHVLAAAHVIKNGYRVDESDIANVRASAAAAAQGDDEKDVGYADFFAGWLLWLHGDLTEAHEQLETSLALAERIGESVLLGASLLGLTLVALRRHDVAAVRSLTPRAMAAASAMGRTQCEADVTACLVWLAWQDGRHDDVVTLSAEIPGHDPAVAVVGSCASYQWVYLWPLIAAHLTADRVGEAVAAALRLRQPSQQRLPADLDAAVQAAVTAWEQDEPDQARDRLAAALALARDLRYC